MYTIAITLLFLVCVYFSYFQHFPLSFKLFFAILLYRVVGLSWKTTKYLLNHSPSSNGGLIRIVSHVCCSSGSSSSTFGWLAASTDYYHSTSFNPIHENAKIVAERAFCHHNVGRGRKAQATEKKKQVKR